MAKKEKRGWIWTDAEKNLGKAWMKGLRRQNKQIAEQIRRFGGMLPEFASEAKDIGTQFTDVAQKLLSLDMRSSGRKYQPMAPEQAKTELEEVQKRFDAWKLFLSRVDVHDAIKEANRAVRGKKREKRKQIEEAKRRALEEIDGPQFQKTLDGLVSLVIEQTALSVKVLHKILGLPNQTDPSLLHRLILVHFVRYTFKFDDDKERGIKMFMGNVPSRSMKEVIREALSLTVKKYALDTISSSGSAIPGLNIPINERIQSLLSGAFGGVLRSIEKLQKEGETLENIDRYYFTILGFDYHPEEKPE